MHEFSQQDHNSGSQQAVNCLDIFKSIPDACKDVYPVANFYTMPLEWDTGVLFGMTTFKAYFVDYMECAIHIKDVTNDKKVMGIEKNIHLF